MKQLPIWSGRGNFPILVGFAEVDDEHAVMLSRFHWLILPTGYVYRKEYKTNIWLHQDVVKLMLWPVADGMLIDHIDRDKRNCQSSNLRVVTHSVSGANRDLPSNNTSGFKCVSWNTSIQKWKAEIHVSRKSVHLGYFDDPKEAARKVNAAYRYHYPEVAIPNPEVEVESR